MRLKDLILPAGILVAAVVVGWLQAGRFGPMSVVLGLVLAGLVGWAFRLLESDT